MAIAAHGAASAEVAATATSAAPQRLTLREAVDSLCPEIKARLASDNTLFNSIVDQAPDAAVDLPAGGQLLLAVPTDAAFQKAYEAAVANTTAGTTGARPGGGSSGGVADNLTSLLTVLQAFSGKGVSTVLRPHVLVVEPVAGATAGTAAPDAAVIRTALPDGDPAYNGASSFLINGAPVSFAIAAKALAAAGDKIPDGIVLAAPAYPTAVNDQITDAVTQSAITDSVTQAEVPDATVTNSVACEGQLLVELDDLLLTDAVQMDAFVKTATEVVDAAAPAVAEIVADVEAVAGAGAAALGAAAAAAVVAALLA